MTFLHSSMAFCKLAKFSHPAASSDTPKSLAFKVGAFSAGWGSATSKSSQPVGSFFISASYGSASGEGL